MVSIRLEGTEQLQSAIREATGDVREAVSNAVIGTALELRGDIVKSIQSGPASGRIYQKYNPRRTHRASAPGQPPMSDTGRLASSIEFEQIGEMTASVGSILAYATYLEYGTSNMTARPFLRPAAEEIRQLFQRRLERAVSGAVT